MPMWGKILLGIVILGFLGVVGLGFAGYMFFKDSFAVDPAKISTMAEDIATIQQPLPAGFKWSMGTDFKVMKMVIATAPDQQSIILLSVPTAEKSAQDLLGDPSLSSSSGTTMTDIEKSGTTTVAGLPMEYRLGTIQKKDGSTAKGYMGAVVDKSKHKSMLLIGVQPHGEYNLPETEQFLRGITAF
jgi:hypothetical protein